MDIKKTSHTTTRGRGLLVLTYWGMWMASIVVLLLYPAMTGTCQTQSASPTDPATFEHPMPLGESSTNDLSSVHNFTYQLQDIDLQAMGNTSFDLAIIDYSSDGCENGEFSSNQIQALRHSPGGDKIILAYMSIGEAEEYRFYWQNTWSPGQPSWLGEENPDWEGNYKVRYWEAGWQTIILEYTDRLLDAGFDGAYLDIIDAYEYYADRGRASAAQDMVDFVAAIRAYARTRDPGFFIVPQNAPELATSIPDYLNHVDGIGQEDIYYGYDGDGIATPAGVTAEMENYLNVFRDSGKLVLTVDYPFGDHEDIPHYDADTRMKIDDAYASSSANGYVPYCTVRNLSYLTINPGHEPTEVGRQAEKANSRTFVLYPNFPNPFNAGTTILFRIENHRTPVPVCVNVFNIRGEKIVTLLDGLVESSTHSVRWDGYDEHGLAVPSSVYVCRIQARDSFQTQRLLLIR